MKIKIEIDCNNSAFQDCPTTEASRILSGICQDLNASGHFHPCKLHDYNGNCVGSLSVWISDHPPVD